MKEDLLNQETYREEEFHLPLFLQKNECSDFEFKKSSMFLGKNLNTLSKLLDKIRFTRNEASEKNSPYIRLLEFMILTIVISLSKNLIFLWITSLFFLSKLALFKGSTIISVVKRLFILCLLSFVFILPGVIFANNVNPSLFLFRVGVNLLNLSIFSASTPFPSLVKALRQLGMPMLFVQTMDICYKYIYVLGNVTVSIIEAVKLRCIGMKEDKRLVGAIIGQLYLSTDRYTRELYEAMVLRGYNLNNLRKKRLSFNRYDLLSVLRTVVLLIVFIVLK